MSMTLQEAAIKSCEDRIKHLESTPIHHYGKRQRERAIELERVKIAALRPITREQVEKVWRGEWVGMTDDDGCTWYECSRCEYGLDSLEDPNHFCSACGAPMTDEAVEIIMERLEEMYENQ